MKATATAAVLLLLLAAVSLQVCSASPRTVMRKRAQFSYGSLFVEGSPYEIEFFRATFGGAIPCEARELVLAEPFLACEALNAEQVAGKVLVTKRGECSFADKAIHAVNAGAAGMVVINNEGGLIRMPHGAVNVDNVTFPVIMIGAGSGESIRRALVSRDGTGLMASMSPNVEPCLSPMAMDAWFSSEVPMTEAELEEVESANAGHDVEVVSQTFGGIIGVLGTPSSGWFEWVASDFGGILAAQSDIHLVVAEPADGCSEIQGDVAGKWVAVQRGVCPMINKTRHAQDAGAAGIVLINNQGIGAVAAKGDDTPFDVHIPVIMVSTSTWEAMRSAMSATWSLAPTKVTAFIWDDLEQLFELPARDWPTDAAARTQWLTDLVHRHHPMSPTGHWRRFDIVRELAEEAGYEDELNAVVQSSGEVMDPAQYPSYGEAEETTIESNWVPHLLTSRPHAVLSARDVGNVPRSSLNCKRAGGRWVFNDPTFQRGSMTNLPNHLSNSVRDLLCLEKLYLRSAAAMGQALRYAQGHLSPKQFNAHASHALRANHVEDDLAMLDLYLSVADKWRNRDGLNPNVRVDEWLAMPPPGADGAAAGAEGADTAEAEDADIEVTADGEWSV